ncbi:MAG: PadR family transcriptional regulator [Candidatus Bathyarchaeia archaeon]|nr:MAG: transcriptional regulator [Candidatus Bathyarchaeota archaeon]
MAEEVDIVRAIARGFSRAVILWLISQKSMSGYAIVKEIEKLTGQKFHAGIIYPLLYELEKVGFISGEWTQKGRRHIKYYSITEKGAQMLNQLRQRFEMPIKEVLKDFIKETLKNK